MYRSIRAASASLLLTALVIAGLPAPGRADTVSAWRKELAGADFQGRLLAVQELGNLGSQARAAVPDLARILNDSLAPDAGPEQVQQLFNLQAQAGAALGKIGAVPELTEALNRNGDAPVDLSRRSAALQGLIFTGADGKPALPTLLKLAQDPDQPLRPLVVAALVVIAPENPAAIKELSRYWNDPAVPATARDRGMLLVRVASAGPRAKPAVPVLLEILQSSSPWASVAAVVLGRVGPAAREAVPALIKALNPEDPVGSDMLAAASTALRRIGTSEALQALEQAAPAVRRRIAESLDSGSPPNQNDCLFDEGRVALPLLIKALGNSQTAQMAAQLLGLLSPQLGPQLTEAVPALLKTLNPDDPVRGELLETLGWALLTIQTTEGKPDPRAVKALDTAFRQVSKRIAADNIANGLPDEHDVHFNNFVGPRLNALELPAFLRPEARDNRDLIGKKPDELRSERTKMEEIVREREEKMQQCWAEIPFYQQRAREAYANDHQALGGENDGMVSGLLEVIRECRRQKFLAQARIARIDELLQDQK